MHQAGDGSTLTNAGTIRKSAGTGESVLEHPKPENGPDGRIEVLTGTLRLPVGVSGDGTFHVAEGAELRCENSADLSDVFLTGNGAQRFTGGTLTLSGMCRADHAVLAGARLNGTHTLAGNWEWGSGAWDGPGTTTVASDGTIQLTGANDHVLDNHTVVVEGGFAHIGTGKLRFVSGIVEIRAGGLVDLRSDAEWDYQGGDIGVIDNEGISRKSAGTGTSALTNLSFANRGSLSVWHGILTFASDLHLDGQGGVIVALSSPTDYGRIHVNRSLPLAGSLTVIFQDEFLPGVGQQ